MSAKKLTIVLFTITLAPLLSVPLVWAHSGGEAVAIFTENPPTIDGNDDWPAEVWAEALAHDMHMKPEDTPAWFMFNETSPNRISRGVIDDDTDFSAEFAFMYDEEWLYFIGKFVDDNVPDNLQSGEVDNVTGPVEPHTSMWWLEFDYEHDAPEKPRGDDDRDLAADPGCLYQAGDHFYWLKPWTGEGLEQPACFENHGQNAVLGDQNNLDEECTSNMVSSLTADGFIIEGKLNFETIFDQSTKGNLPIPTDGTVWGFDSSGEDHEVAGGGREGAISWASSFENDNTTCIFGDLLFQGARAVHPKNKLSSTWGTIKRRAGR